MKKLSLLFLSILTIASCSNERKMGGGCVGDDCQATYKVDAPVFNILDGSNVSAGTELTITTETEDAEIKYTINGDDPLEEGQVYTAPISINNDVTVKAIAVKDGMDNSEEVSASYTISVPNQVAAPTFVPGPNSGSILKGTAVHIYTTTPGAIIRYNIGSTNPTISSGIVYNQNNPPTLTSVSTIKAIAYMSDNSQPASGVASATYTFQTAVKPVIVASGTYPNSGSTICTNNTISITTITTGATIRYNLTTDGSMPLAPTSITSGLAYTGPISLSQYYNKAVKVRATAFRSDMNSSAAAYAYYDVLAPGSLPKPKVVCSGPLTGSSKTVTISVPAQDCTQVTGGTSIFYKNFSYQYNQPYGTNYQFWTPYSSSYVITSSKDIVAVTKGNWLSNSYSEPAVKSCCVGSGCLQAIDEEAIIK